ncbi:ribonuclease H-like domain-containing protein [Tanacetum coccineum]
MVTYFHDRTNHPTQRLNLHVSSISPLPKSYTDVFNDQNWQNAMCDEYNTLIKNDTWTLSLQGSSVANGSMKLEGIDVDETFNPVVKLGTIWTVLTLATSRHWPVHQLDVQNAFLHGDLSETGTDTAYLLLYIDDIVRTTSFEILLQQIIASLHLEFSMTDLERAHMVNCNPCQTPVDTKSKLGDNIDPISDPT